MPGSYTASLEERSGREWKTLTDPVTFEVEALELATLTAADQTAVERFQKEVRELRRSVLGASKRTDEVKKRLNHLRQALVDTPEADPALMAELEGLKGRCDDIVLAFRGDATKAGRNVFTPPSIVSRVERIAYDQWYTTQAPTTTHRQAYEWAAEAFATEMEKLQQLVTDLEEFEAKAESANAPWTPGRVPMR
jgi:chromosome segregation ATPase